MRIIQKRSPWFGYALAIMPWRQKQLRDAAKKDLKPPFFIYAAAA